jgi:rubrerythrin
MDERLERVGRYAAAARGLEREGAYNAAKLLRAAMQRELVRHAEAEAPAGSTLAAAALESLLAHHRQDLPDGMAEILDPLPAAVRAGHTIALVDAPRVRVCRICGTTFLGDDVPQQCPECEAPALSFHEELPVWYLAPADRGMILAALASGPHHLEHALAGRADASLAEAPAPGEWSARQTLEHLLFTEELLALRIRRLLEEDEPNLAAAAVWADTPASDEGSADTGGEAATSIAHRIEALRRETVATLADLDDAAWGRAGQHPEWGRVTVLSQAAYFARHEASHHAQLVAAADGRLPGRTATGG